MCWFALTCPWGAPTIRLRAGGRSFSLIADQAVGQDALVGQRLGNRAHDEHLDREIAIKVLRPVTLADEFSRKHFRKEALALSKLNHPNIATIHDFDTQQDVDLLKADPIWDPVRSDPRFANLMLRIGLPE